MLDLPRYLIEAGLARVRHRNPPATPWWRRYVRSWQAFSPAPLPASDAPGTGDFPVYGLCMAWNEDDVIYATVRNLLRQGVDKVFVIDDESDDRTADEAQAAGATVLRDRSDGTFDERRRTARISQVIDEQTRETGTAVWWVVVDADEFPAGPGGSTIRELARRLPPRVDTVGSRVLEHYPGKLSAPLPRHHPIDQLPNACWHDNPSCPAGHWKHQMFLLRRPGEIQVMPGRHTIAAPRERKPVIEGTPSLLMHHFPLRGRERARQHLASARPDSGQYGKSAVSFRNQRLANRARLLDLAYQEKYDSLPNTFPGQRKLGNQVRDWRTLVGPTEREVRHQPGMPL